MRRSAILRGWTLAAAALHALPAQTLTLAGAVERALHNYPSIRVSQEQINAAAAGIQLARTAYLPRIDALAQANRGTRNNVFGMLLPQSVIPSMSGPVLGTNNGGSAWGSAIGTLVSWEPFDFGLRSANVAAASAARGHSEATLRRTEFDVTVATVDAYLSLAAAEETVRAAQAGVDRAEVVSRITSALVDAQLRPGADASRAQAELAAARTELIQAQQATAMARAIVAQYTGMEPSAVAISAGHLLDLPPERPVEPLNPAANPAVLEQNAAVEQAMAQLRALERTYFPRFQLQASAYARGTGAETDGALLGGLNGLAPTFQNYALGFTVSFPVFDLPSLRARESAQAAMVRSQKALADQIAVDLKGRWNMAVARLEGAQRTAANTPVEVAASRTAASQAQARYQSGLGNIEEVAEAERLVTQSEIDDALARLGVWRGLLGIATAAGDLQPLIAEVGQ